MAVKLYKDPNGKESRRGKPFGPLVGTFTIGYACTSSEIAHVSRTEHYLKCSMCKTSVNLKARLSAGTEDATGVQGVRFAPAYSAAKIDDMGWTGDGRERTVGELRLARKEGHHGKLRARGIKTDLPVKARFPEPGNDLSGTFTIRGQYVAEADLYAAIEKLEAHGMTRITLSGLESIFTT